VLATPVQLCYEATWLTNPVYEMYHHIPFPMSNRVFNTLVITARYHTHGSIVIQIPVDLSKFPPTVMERSHQDISKKKYRTKEPNGTWKQSAALAHGIYSSVERIKLDGEDIIWEMATASDAGGNIPEVMTKLALPSQIAKDVGFFLGWVEENRKKG
jgi:hypothetical protein